LAEATGVRSLLEKDKFQKGYEYSWDFYIVPEK